MRVKVDHLQSCGVDHMQSRKVDHLRYLQVDHMRFTQAHIFSAPGGGRQRTTATQICIYIHPPIKKYIPARLLYTLGAVA